MCVSLGCIPGWHSRHEAGFLSLLNDPADPFFAGQSFFHLRLSLEGPGMMAGQEVPAPTMMEGSEPIPPEAAESMKPAMPTSSQIEESILGSKSAYVDQAPEPIPTPEPVQPTGFGSTPVTAEFSSSKYESDDDSTPPGLEEEATTGFSPKAPPVSTSPAAS